MPADLDGHANDPALRPGCRRIVVNREDRLGPRDTGPPSLIAEHVGDRRFRPA
jgi:hypothetical protein